MKKTLRNPMILVLLLALVMGAYNLTTADASKKPEIRMMIGNNHQLFSNLNDEV